MRVRPSPNAPDGRYVDGTHIELRAIGAEGFEFTGWDGACVGDDDECRIVINRDISVTANFVVDFYTLTINQVLVGGSSVSVDHGLIVVTPVADAANNAYAAGVIVSLTANPDAGYVLADWGGDCSDLEPDATECTLTMNGDKLVDVAFVEETADNKS